MKTKSKRLSNGIVKKIHLKTGIPRTKISDYVSARCRPGASRAFILQDATGIDARLWVEGTEKQIRKALNGPKN